MKVQILTLRKDKIANFAKERNILLGKAKSDWILFLDGDEKLSKELKREIEWLDPNEFSGFLIKRENYFLGQYIGTEKILRLGRKDSGKWERRVHETWKVRGKVRELKNPIIHNSSANLREAIAKINGYSTLHAEAKTEEGKKSDILKIVFYPKIKFWQSMLMGRGVVFSILQSFHSFLAWSKLYLSHS